MPQKQTNFDHYLADKRTDPVFEERFKAADRAWTLLCNWPHYVRRAV